MDRLPALIALLALLGGEARAATVRGEVAGFPDGEPLPGVQVLVRDPQGRSVSVDTDASGRFEAPGVDPGLARIQAVPGPEMNRLGAYAGDVSAFCAASTFQLGAESVLDGVRIELPVGGSILGSVDGVGAGAVVRAEGADTLNLSVVRSAEVSALGAFEVLGLASWLVDGEVLPGAYVVSATDGAGGRFWHPGTWDRAAAERVPAVRGEVTALDLARPAGADLTGCLVDPGGSPWPGASISVRASEGSFSSTADAAGCFALQDLPGAELSVTVDSDGLARTQLPAVAAAGLVDLGEVTIAVEATLELVGVAVTQIALVPTGTEGPALVFPVGGDGRARRLPAGEWDVLAPAWPTVDWLPARAPVTLSSGQEAVTVVVPEPAGAIEVAVLRRADAFGLRGARVEAWDPATEMSLGVATTSAGVARLTGLPRSSVLLRASWEPFCPADGRLVPAWSGDARDGPFASELSPLPDGDVSGPVLTLRLPPDADGDAMDDVWELLVGLPTDRQDAGDDPDGDGLDNVSEYRGYTDPLVAEGLATGCSIGDGAPTCAARRLLSLALLATLVVGGARRR